MVGEYALHLDILHTYAIRPPLFCWLGEVLGLQALIHHTEADLQLNPKPRPGKEKRPNSKRYLPISEHCIHNVRKINQFYNCFNIEKHCLWYHLLFEMITYSYAVKVWSATNISDTFFYVLAPIRCFRQLSVVGYTIFFRLLLSWCSWGKKCPTHLLPLEKIIK